MIANIWVNEYCNCNKMWCNGCVNVYEHQEITCSCGNTERFETCHPGAYFTYRERADGRETWFKCLDCGKDADARATVPGECVGPAIEIYEWRRKLRREWSRVDEHAYYARRDYEQAADLVALNDKRRTRKIVRLQNQAAFRYYLALEGRLDVLGKRTQL